MNSAQLIEIFASPQGEGPYVGVPMTFVRFQDCALSCSFCDTPASFKKHASFRYETPEYSEKFSWQANPISSEELTRMLATYSPKFLSLTGGEPLQQSSFIRHWLAELKGKYKILLETNGVLPRELENVIEYTDIVSMDIKLPSVTGMRAYWHEHAEFLQIAKRKEVYVKVVVSEHTALEEWNRAIELVESIAPNIPFVLQPLSLKNKKSAGIAENKLRQLYELSQKKLQDVRVVPQVHAQLGLL